MPVTQEGTNATANIHHDFNDIRGNQFNLVVRGNDPPQVSLAPFPTDEGFATHFNLDRAHRRKILENTLEDTIQIIREIASLVHIDVANMILIDIATMLSLLQEHTRNKDRLNALTRSCKAICSTVTFATKGFSSSMDRISGAHWNALHVLQLSIDNLRSQVRDALQLRRRRHRVNRPVHGVWKISTWTMELEKISISFSARLNIVSVVRLEQIRGLLQQTGVPNLIPDPPPPTPAMFFGREELLRAVKSALLREEDITLIGPGGIGKSTLAMMVMNEEDIIQRYMRRFFVTYEGLSPKTITFASFVDQIASVLGLPMSGAEGERQIKTNLALSPVLLVLDNAETFEDAVDRGEAMRISDFIAHIANTPKVTVVLTSRTSSNARRVSWTQFDVPPLEREPARVSFRKIYPGEISDEEIDGLLATVDFHPLSISILAHTARENRWTGNVLLDRWKSQHGEILQMGDGKDNLGFTIRLSLESPSVMALGDDALHVLWVIAFFPQGIQADQDHLTRLFPSVHRISSVVDTFCKVSLIYPSGSFLTTLAPIRLFLLDAFPIGGLELLGEARRVYYGLLDAISEDKDSLADLLVSDHLNIESLIAFDIAHSPTSIRDTMYACCQFLRGLRYHKPRPTLLSPAITSLPEETNAEKESKARCLDALGDLYLELSNYSFASTASSAAQRLFVAVRKYTEAARCASTTALSHNTRGNFSQARRLLDDFMSSSSWQYVDKERKAKIHYTLDVSRMHSSHSVNDLFLRSMDDSFRGLQSRVRHWQARMHHGYITPEEVQKHIEPLRSDSMLSSNMWNRWRFLETAAEAAFLQRKFDVAVDLLDQAHESVNGSFRLSVNILICKAAVASDQGDYALSRYLSQRCVDTLGVVATASSTKFLHVLYVRGRNELYAGHYSTARRFLADVIVQCDVCGDIRTKALCMRALGEAEILGRKADSNRYFGQTVTVCKESGTPPELLGVCNPMLKLDDDKFLGWKRFLAAHPGSVSDEDFLHSLQTVSIR